jgi:DNA-binding response OmpR family regulator
MSNLLLIEDDGPLRRALRMALEDEGHVVREAPDGATGLSVFAAEQIDLVLLDLRLPDTTGFDVCREIRRQSFVPVIIITAETDTHDLVAGLEAGADDYVTKPITTKALAARIRAHLRRAGWQGDGQAEPVFEIEAAGIEIRESEGVVLKHGVRVPLTKTEFRLLCEFARRPRQVLSRDHLLEAVWGYEYVGDGRLVDTHIRRLRPKIEDDVDHPALIVTVRGLGYRFDAGVTR